MSPARPSSCAICVIRPPAVQRFIGDRPAWICAGCDGETAVRTRTYRTARHERKWQARRRAANLASERCINENKRGTHGPATVGVRCAACAAAHRRTA